MLKDILYNPIVIKYIDYFLNIYTPEFYSIVIGVLF